jgi:hypothetical protein
MMTKNEVVNSALSKNTKIAMRAEKVKNYELLYVDAIDIASFESNENQLVYGRRGTGKTHLLGTLTERINQGAEPVVAFYFNATDFVKKVGEVSRLPLPEQANAYFHSFIEVLAQKLFDLVAATFEEDTGSVPLPVGSSGEQIQRRAVAEHLLNLIDAAAVGSHFLPESELSRMLRRLEQLADSGAVEASAVSSILQSRQARSLLGAHYAEFNLAKVRDIIIEIVTGLNLDYIVILIDEWMHIQRAQVEFAERLKQCLFGTDRIAIKIAADQYRDELGNASIGHEFRGLEISADIFVKADLDHPFRASGSADLYAEVLYRRLLFLQPELEKHFGPPPLSNPARFINALFANQHAFEELCRGAQGICRDFHESFQTCVSRRGGNLIDYELVQRVLIDSAAPMYRSIKNLAASTLFGELIVPHVSNTGAHFFLTDQIQSEFGYLIASLLSRRVIHGVPVVEGLDPTIKAKYDIFEIEYGIYLEQRRKAQFISAAVPAIGLEDLTSLNCDDYVLDFSPISSKLEDFSSKIHCESCGRSFSKYNEYYVVAGKCPNPSCLADQPGWVYEREEVDDEE